MPFSNLALLIIYMLVAAFGFAAALAYPHIKPYYRKAYITSVITAALAALAALLILAKP